MAEVEASCFLKKSP